MDFDWIFEEDNAKTLLRILANDANDAALTMRSIKIFIDLMWSHYQMEIVKFVLLPFIFYMACLISLSLGMFADLMDDLQDPTTDTKNSW